MTTSAARRTTGSEQAAKEPVTRLAGPYGHPFHPILVTVPIGAWVASLGFDLAAQWADEPEVFAKGAFWLVLGGIAGALAAAVFGLMDLLTIPRGTRAFRTGLAHMALNTTTVVLFAVSALIRQGRIDDGEVPGAALALSIVALAVLGVSGWLGGTLTYHYGVRVASEADQADAFKG